MNMRAIEVLDENGEPTHPRKWTYLNHYTGNWVVEEQPMQQTWASDTVQAAVLAWGKPCRQVWFNEGSIEGVDYPVTDEVGYIIGTKNSI